MEAHFRSEERKPDDLASVIASLEPDQLSAAKAQHHFRQRQFTGLETFLFWALRFYLVFMFGVVIFQIWKGTR